MLNAHSCRVPLAFYYTTLVRVCEQIVEASSPGALQSFDRLMVFDESTYVSYV